MKSIKQILMLPAILLLATSCSIGVRTLKQPSSYVEFQKDDFIFSEQVTGEATQVKILFVDWARLLNWKSGDIGGIQASIPVISSLASSSPMMLKDVDMYAIYNILQDNPGYDVVFYPQFEKEIDNKIIIKTTKVKVTARLGKLK